MLKPFILVYNTFQLTRQEILDFLDSRPEVKNWYAFLPTSIMIISDRTAYQLAEIFRQKYPNTYFIISEIPYGNNDGWLDKKVWSFINNSVSSGRWPPLT